MFEQARRRRGAAAIRRRPLLPGGELQAARRGDRRCRDNWRECTLPALNALSCSASARSRVLLSLSCSRASSGCFLCSLRNHSARGQCVCGQFDRPRCDRLEQHALPQQTERLEATVQAPSSFAGTYRGDGWRPGGQLVRRGFRPGQSQKLAPRGVALDIDLHPITLIGASTSTRENHTPNRASGPNFHHHI